MAEDRPVGFDVWFQIKASIYVTIGYMLSAVVWGRALELSAPGLLDRGPLCHLVWLAVPFGLCLAALVLIAIIDQIEWRKLLIPVLALALTATGLGLISIGAMIGE